MKFLTLPLTKKTATKKQQNKTKREREREEQKHNQTSKTFLKLLKNFH